MIKIHRMCDADTDRLFRYHGWGSLGIWEHDSSTGACRVIQGYSCRQKTVGP